VAKYRRRARRDRITIQTPTRAETAYGQQKTTGYANVAGLTNLHADFEHTGGTETFRGRQIEPSVIGVFEIRMPRVDVEPTYRVLHTNKSDKAYEIVSARPAENQFEGGERTMWIFVKAIA
jgi:hypothetical protein